MSSAMRKAQKKMAKEQAKREKKYIKKETARTTNQVLGIKSIAEFNQKSKGEMLKSQFTLAWYFESWYEKLILVILCAFGLWKIVGFF